MRTGIDMGTETGTGSGQLDGKVAVVTGGSAGIGLATAHRFVREGARVFITGRREAELAAAVAELGGSPAAVGVRGDVSRVADLERLYAAVADAGCEAIDVLVVNAGGGPAGGFADFTEEQFDATSDLNFRGAFFTVQRALPLLRDGASVILLGSAAGSSASTRYGVYAAAKAAVRSLARSLALELAGRSIRVNTLSPGPIDTPALAQAPATVRERATAGVPLGRAGRPEEVAAAALFLASGESSFITGIELFVDGGAGQV
ncbi:SDR family NAD(P)-dependent oxidoreductase [Streptomyces sp. NBC_00503]|uniref:SDR family NAD(P)-dependent oxidoreductase n=1 Tax=Streptomyces sp. NBC_00503 TaxID=2903659 RepID=UPI002E819CCF|nr:SDR family oxidoreductase [Streptomyces sp. NBC_00503]WUD79880.1 SDR family oxidoreductase [Streptomyces sp. NBC_00503]